MEKQKKNEESEAIPSAPSFSLDNATVTAEPTVLEQLKQAQAKRLSQARPKGSVVMAPLPGFTWNPLTTLPRNRQCPCLSGQKFKLCCLPKLPKVIPVKDAELFREQMEKPDLIFLTKENEALVKSVAKRTGENDLLGDEVKT